MTNPFKMDPFAYVWEAMPKKYKGRRDPPKEEG